MELDGVGEGAGEGRANGAVAFVKEDSCGFEDGDGAAAVVVGAGSAEDGWQEEVDAVLVGADDDCFVALAWDAEYDGGLAPGMGKCGDGGIGVSVLAAC